MSVELPPKTLAGIRDEIDQKTSGQCPKIAGLVYCAVGRSGDILVSHASGQTGLGSGNQMTLETVFWMASCTKLITSIACMQIVEQNALALDDVEQVETLAPELKAVQVLERTVEGGFRLVPKERGITLRMLLNHTCMVSQSQCLL